MPGIISVIGDPQFDIFSETVGNLGLDSLSSIPDRTINLGLLALHRAENVDDKRRLDKILSALSAVAEESGIEWVFPVHPRTSRNMTATRLPGLKTIDPLGYEDLLRMLRVPKVCVTDSGALQKEALRMGGRCVTIRLSTEWTEALVDERNRLADNPDQLVSMLLDALNKKMPINTHNPYGSLGALELGARHISNWLKKFD